MKKWFEILMLVVAVIWLYSVIWYGAVGGHWK